jgi:hypothetical protein
MFVVEEGRDERKRRVSPPPGMKGTVSLSLLDVEEVEEGVEELYKGIGSCASVPMGVFARGAAEGGSRW